MAQLEQKNASYLGDFFVTNIRNGVTITRDLYSKSVRFSFQLRLVQTLQRPLVSDAAWSVSYQVNFERIDTIT